MSVLVCNTNHYECKEKYEDIDDNTCEICYSNKKHSSTDCKTCNKKICFECFYKYDKGISLPTDIEDRLNEEKCYIYHTYKCFFCRSKIDINIGDFDIGKMGKLVNKQINENIKMIERAELLETEFKCAGNGEKIEDIPEYQTIVVELNKSQRENDELRYKLEKFEELTLKFDNLMTTYNKNIEDYNNLVNDCNNAKKQIIQMSYTNQYICNQRDSTKIIYKRAIDTIQSKNKNKNLDKTINKIKEDVDKLTTEPELIIKQEFNELVRK
jgi:hypothetical protein